MKLKSHFDLDDFQEKTIMTTNTTKTAIGYLIDPHTKTVTQVTLPLVDDNVPIRAMYELMGVNCVDVAHIRGLHSQQSSFDLWVDDEGLLQDEGQAYFYVSHEAGAAYGSRMFAGKALVLSTDREGNTKGATVDMRTLGRRIVWAHPEEGKREAEEMVHATQVVSFDSFDDMLDYMRNNQGGV